MGYHTKYKREIYSRDEPRGGSHDAHLRRWDASRVSCENNAATAEPLCRSVVILTCRILVQTSSGKESVKGRIMRPDNYVFLTVGSLAFVSQKTSVRRNA